MQLHPVSLSAVGVRAVGDYHSQVTVPLVAAVPPLGICRQRVGRTRLALRERPPACPFVSVRSGVGGLAPPTGVFMSV